MAWPILFFPFSLKGVGTLSLRFNSAESTRYSHENCVVVNIYYCAYLKQYSKYLEADLIRFKATNQKREKRLINC